MKKRGFSWILASLFAVPFVFAQQGPFDVIFGWIRISTFTNPDIYVIAKILLGVLLFALIYVGASTALKKDGKPNTRIATVVAFCVSAITMFAVPLELVKTIADSSAGVFINGIFIGIIILAFLGAKIIKGLTSSKEVGHTLQSFVYAVALGLLSVIKFKVLPSFSALNTGFGTGPLYNIVSMINLAIAICFILLVYNVIMIFASSGAGGDIESAYGYLSKNLEKRTNKWKTRELNDFVNEKEELRKIELIQSRNKDLIAAIDDAMKKGVMTAERSQAFMSFFVDQLKPAATGAFSYFRKLRRGTYKQISGMHKIEQLYRSKDKTTEEIDAIEKGILKLHDETASILAEVVEDLNKIEPDLNLVYDYSRRNQIAIDGTIKERLTKIRNSLIYIDRDVETASEKQREVLTDLEALIIEVNKELNKAPAIKGELLTS